MNTLNTVDMYFCLGTAARRGPWHSGPPPQGLLKGPFPPPRLPALSLRGEPRRAGPYGFGSLCNKLRGKGLGEESVCISYNTLEKKAI